MADADRIARAGIATPTAVVIAEEINSTAGGGVTSVNGNTGVVVLDYSDVGALEEPTPASAIADLTLTGTYTDDDDNIEAAVNGILAILRANGFLAT